MEHPQAFVVEPWQFHDHPTSGHRIVLDMDRLTIFDPQGGQTFLSAAGLPDGRWVSLDGRPGSPPLRLRREGYVAGLSPSGRLLAEWLPRPTRSRPAAETEATAAAKLDRSLQTGQVILDVLKRLPGTTSAW